MHTPGLINFRFDPTFTMLDEFKLFNFNLYWSYEVVEPNQFEPYLQKVVGHPSGHAMPCHAMPC